MADGNFPLTFRISELPPRAPVPPVRPPEPDRAPPKLRRRRRADPPPDEPFGPPPPPPRKRTAGRFTASGKLLSFLSTVASTQLASRAECRRSPDGTHWWGEVELPWDQAAELVWSTGGVPFAWEDGNWRLVVPGGGPTDDHAGTIPPPGDDWPATGLAELLAGVSAAAGPTIATSESVAVVAPGAIARWVVRRALSAGLTATVRPVDSGPLYGDGPVARRLLARLSAARGTVPAALLTAISRLPATTVARTFGGPEGRLFVDVRCHLPLAASQFDEMIPADEAWVLSAPDTGHVRLVLAGAEADAAGLLLAPAGAPAPAVALSPDPVPPRPIPVRLVRSPGRRPDRPDAVLVDDAQLEWLRAFLPTSPAAELGFLLPGPGHHLLTAPGGLPASVPFGVPMTCVGPGGLYVEAGFGFSPPLPPAARRAAFEVGGTRVVAVTRDGAFAFDPEQVVPAWSLWLGKPTEVRTGMSPLGQAVLRAVADSIRQAERDRAKAEPPERRTTAAPDRSELLREAERLEFAGQWAEGAVLLEQAGEYLQAARLYERAAAGI
jgi:hypothetical protein